MLLNLKELTGSLTKALDIIYVLENSKPVSRLISNNDNKQLIEFLGANNLSYEFSDFKILKHTDSTRSYSDKGIKVKKDDKREGDFFIYISKKKELAEKAKKAEENDHHLELGKLLGYPECCARFFEENFEKASKGTNDLTPHTFRESKGFSFPWQNNNCLRGFDIGLLSHFPCNFNCEASKKIAEKNLGVIKKHDSDISNYFENALKCSLIYSEGIGIYSFKKFSVNKKGIDYHPDSIIPSNKNDFYNLLRRRNNISIIGKNDFLIGDVRITDTQTFFALFS